MGGTRNTINKVMAEHKKIILVDDDPDILQGVKLILERMGDYDVQQVAHGEELLSLHEDSRPELILLDLGMPGLNGQQICQILKGNSITRHIPLIIFSGNTDTERIAHACGADDYLTKPFHMNQLVKKVEKWLD